MQRLQLSPDRALVAVRIVACTMLFIHGITRSIEWSIPIFGEWLKSEGFRFGFAIALTITAMELFGTLLLASGRLVRPLALWFVGQLTMGIILVHAKWGWFVVGGGRNGMEYSVLLIALFLTVAAVGTPQRKLATVAV